MPPRRPARPAPPDIDQLRRALAGGKIVRVGIAPSAQFPEGVTGRVRSIGDPATDGDEYLQVEVPVNGAKDVLPFAPADLLGAPMRRSAPGVGPGPTNRPARSRPGSGEPAVDSPEEELFPAPARAVASLVSAAKAPTAMPSSPEGDPARPAAKRSTGSPRAKRPPVTITISTSGDETVTWRIEARIGAKVAVRPTPVPPSRVWEIVESLGEPKLSALVQSLLEDHRRSTQARADQLAFELAALQTELESFPVADR